MSLGLADGDRIGVVGRNGDGKSTLLRVLARRIEPDDGRVTWRRDLRVGLLDQADRLDPELIVSTAVVADRAEHEWAGDPRVRDILTGLLSDVPWDGRIGELSGGQRRRVALAQVLVGEHDVVFLDEPTNHLDLEGVMWLAEHVKSRWPAGTGGLAVVTHDRWFLDEVCTHTWEVHDGVVEPFEGGYAAYVLQRVERDRQAAAAESRRQNLMRKELAWLRRGAPARTSKPKFRIDAANALIEREPPVRDPTELVQLATARLGKDVVDLLDVSVSFGENEVLRDVEWRIAPGERAGILGVNGAGKSTLLGLVTGTVKPTSGRVKRGKTVQVGTLSQTLAELEPFADDRVSDVVAKQRTSFVAAGQELSPGQLLERLGFSHGQLATPVRDLSGGQKRRLQLLVVLLAEPNVLILDEPTNDLDTDMLGCHRGPPRLLAGHLARRLARPLPGRARHRPPVRGAGRTPAAPPRRCRRVPAAPGGPGRRRHDRPLSLSQPASDAKKQRQDRKEVDRLERQIEKLSAREAELEKQMVEAATDPESLIPLDAEHREVVARREQAEDAWLSLTT